MKDVYNLRGHDGGLNAKFVKEKDDVYNIELENEYCRIGYDTDRFHPNFIDPSGGPFISVGYKTSNVEVIRLFYENNSYKVQLKLI